jgi:hypothetical protein
MRVLLPVLALVFFQACQGQQHPLPESPIPSDISAWDVELLPADPVQYSPQPNPTPRKENTRKRYTLMEDNRHYTVIAGDPNKDKMVSVVVADLGSRVTLSVLAQDDGQVTWLAEQEIANSTSRLLLHDPPLDFLSHMLRRHGSGLPTGVRRLVQEVYVKVRAERRRL